MLLFAFLPLLPLVALLSQHLRWCSLGLVVCLSQVGPAHPKPAEIGQDVFVEPALERLPGSARTNSLGLHLAPEESAAPLGISPAFKEVLEIKL